MKRLNQSKKVMQINLKRNRNNQHKKRKKIRVKVKKLENDMYINGKC